MINRRDDAARSVVPLRIVAQRPLMDIRSVRKSFQGQPAAHRIAHLRKAARTVPARAPSAGHVLDVSKKVITTTLQPKGNRVRRAPFVRGGRVEETNQNVELSALTNYFAGSAARIVDCFCRD